MECKFIVRAMINLEFGSKGFQELVRGFRDYSLEVAPTKIRDVIMVEIKGVSREDIIRYQAHAMCNVNFDYKIELTDDERDKIFHESLEFDADEDGIAKF